MPIYRKLILVLLSVLVLITSAVFTLGLWGSERYQQELTQQLHLDTAHYIESHLTNSLLDSQGTPNVSLLKNVAMNAMMINPLVEIYLLDSKGKILGHALHTDDIVLSHVDTRPIKRLLNTKKSLLIKGDNPRYYHQQQVFSVTPIMGATNDEGGNSLTGYLYVILASQKLKQLSQNIGSSYVLRLLFVSFSALVFILTVIGCFGFYKITRPLRQLQQRIQKIQSIESMQGTHLYKRDSELTKPCDEIKMLAKVFDAMQQRIEEQFKDLKHTDSLRRELFSNISHDLRTPVSSIQGYIETLLIKQHQLSSKDSRKYLEIALKNCQRLTQLIDTLFELARLDVKGMQPQREIFSLPELIHDIVQQYELIAAQQQINIRLSIKDADIYINADIGLIARVFQNLIDNALSSLSKGGQVAIELSLQQDKVQVEIIDNGPGIASHELPYLFNRYYQNRHQADDNAKNNIKVGTGLGLAIVKRILELHGSIIEVSSQLSKGTQFRFSLTTEPIM